MELQDLKSAQDVIVPQNFDKFTLFPILPVELRLKIWACVLQVPRIVEIRAVGVGRYHPKTAISFCSLTPNPSILYVNIESRLEAIKLYKPMLHNIWGPGIRESTIYLNPSRDTVFLSIPPGNEIQIEEARVGYRALSSLELMLSEYERHYPNEFKSLQRVAAVVPFEAAQGPHLGLDHRIVFARMLSHFYQAKEIILLAKSPEENTNATRIQNYQHALAIGALDDAAEKHLGNNMLMSAWSDPRNDIWDFFEARFRKLNSSVDELTEEQEIQMRGTFPKINIKHIKWVTAGLLPSK